jgi:hypothetical protein
VKYRKKPVVVEAMQWLGRDGHPSVTQYVIGGNRDCNHCTRWMRDHGWIDTKEGGHIVCPGDWVITGVAGEQYPCKPDIFAATYEAEL